jgi:hypothetical protein
VAERLKAHAWKVCMGATPSRVRIPLPPPIPRFQPSRAVSLFDQKPRINGTFCLTLYPAVSYYLSISGGAKWGTESAFPHSIPSGNPPRSWPASTVRPRGSGWLSASPTQPARRAWLQRPGRSRGRPVATEEPGLDPPRLPSPCPRRPRAPLCPPALDRPECRQPLSFAFSVRSRFSRRV